MKRIDFFGPPGSGKTTVLNSLMNPANRPGNWYTDKEFYLMANMELFRISNPTITDRFRQAAFQILSKKTLLPVCREEQEKFFSRHLINYRKLTDLVHEAFTQNPFAPDNIKIYRSSKFKDELKKVMLLSHISGEYTVFFQESLTYRYFEATGDLFNVEEQTEILKRVDFPFADACICLTANIETLLQRLSERKKMSRAHKQMNDRQIEFHLKKSLLCSGQALQVMELLNVPVLYIGEGETVQQATEKIRDFCRDNCAASFHSNRR